MFHYCTGTSYRLLYCQYYKCWVNVILKKPHITQKTQLDLFLYGHAWGGELISMTHYIAKDDTDFNIAGRLVKDMSNVWNMDSIQTIWKTAIKTGYASHTLSVPAESAR